VQVIEELIALAKDISAANARSVELGLNAEELAFYDALAENGSAKALMAHEQLRSACLCSKADGAVDCWMALLRYRSLSTE
jgi:type I site-specific restriction-modification system R (restriction) subunit